MNFSTTTESQELNSGTKSPLNALILSIQVYMKNHEKHWNLSTEWLISHCFVESQSSHLNSVLHKKKEWYTRAAAILRLAFDASGKISTANSTLIFPGMLESGVQMLLLTWEPKLELGSSH